MTTVQWQHDGEQVTCPVSGTNGRQVGTSTVKCLLEISLLDVHNTQYFFCRDKDCPVVYFSSDGGQTFRVNDIRERVFQKEPDENDVLVCYCFRYSVGDIREATDRRDADEIIGAINAGIRGGKCACDWRNPQGDCCLGNVRTLVKSWSLG